MLPRPITEGEFGPMHSFVSDLGLRWPIFQAPTGSIANPTLCAAVADAGALGAMGITWAEARQAVHDVRAVRDQTAKPFQVNYALQRPPVTLAAVLDSGAPVITFSWGDAAPFLRMVRAAGARAGVQVANAMGARRAIEQGADFLICQGLEAGGHVQSTMPLADGLAAVLAVSSDTPVIASGGIVDGVGIAEVLRLGAAGAMLGTRFVATLESGAHPDYKAALLAAQGPAATALTVCFDGDWPYAPHRVLRNATFEAWEAAGCPPVGTRPGEGETVARSAGGEPILRYADTAPRAGMDGRTTEMCLYAGTGCGALHDLPAAGDLVRRLTAELDAAQAVTGR
jgi:nitronate monooxygenase